MSRRIKKTTDKSAPAEASAPPAAPAKKSRKSLAPLTDEQRFATGVFTIPEAARFCACSVSGINKYIREGHLAAVKYPGSGCTRIPGPALASFMRGE